MKIHADLPSKSEDVMAIEWNEDKNPFEVLQLEKGSDSSPAEIKKVLPTYSATTRCYTVECTGGSCDSRGSADLDLAASLAQCFRSCLQASCPMRAAA